MFKRIKLWWLIHRLQSKDAKVRAASAGALGMLGDRRAVEPLIAVLKKPSIIKQTSILVPSVPGDTLVSTSVALALRKLGDPRTLEFLIATLRGSDGQGRSSVQVVLGTLGDPQAVEPLIATLKDPDQAVRCSAVEGPWNAGRSPSCGVSYCRSEG